MLEIMIINKLDGVFRGKHYTYSRYKKYEKKENPRGAKPLGMVDIIRPHSKCHSLFSQPRFIYQLEHS
jgi:hypothetical protein